MGPPSSLFPSPKNIFCFKKPVRDRGSVAAY
jgi:hypothetical protein